MTTKKSKNWFIYLLLIVIALVIINPLSEKEIVPARTIVQSKMDINQGESKKIKTKPWIKTKSSANNLVSIPYKVITHYPTQDIFDENICSIDKLHRDYKASLANATKRLSHQYQHHHYKISKYLELNLYTVKMTKYFEQTLIESIKVLHQEYVKLLGSSAEREVELNLVVTPDRSEYEQYTAFYSDNLIESLGVYFGGLNIAYIDYQNSDDNALKTAIHETVHALNAHIIGKTPRMFNEGMAEFYENMTVKKGNIDIIFYKKQLTKAPYPLMQFFDYQQWPNLDIHKLYYSSWAWIAFMYGDYSRVRSLIAFMEQEQVDPCSAFSAGEAYNIFQETYSTLETDFYDWQQNLSAH